MEKYLFGASIGALVPGFLLLDQYGKQLRAAASSPKCQTTLDEIFSPTSAQIYPHLECLGPRGREIYTDFYNFDLILFPLIYTTFFIGLIRRVWPSNLHWLAIVPLLAFVFDVTENCSIYHLLQTFPKPHEVLIKWIPRLTQLKFLMCALCFLLVVIGSVRKCTQPQVEETAKPKMK